MVIEVAKEFTTSPGGRYKEHGPFSGEEFREKLLHWLCEATNEPITIDFTDCYGTPPGFLEEAFGGLVRHNLCTKNYLRHSIILKGVRPEIEEDIVKYVEEAIPGDVSREVPAKGQLEMYEHFFEDKTLEEIIIALRARLPIKDSDCNVIIPLNILNKVVNAALKSIGK